ncbi:hypothetical protein GCM10022402_00560 [Salinactinospora qingdaonensis]|uniref:Uncharacterized protein n=1 Tax=Salinactinospora qingdaonensis TaxID=702744 RepID=A0ABP7EXR9_9ACTN
MQHDVDAGAVATERFVDRIVDDLPHTVSKTTAVGGPDIHTWPLANRLKAFQDRKVSRGVILGVVEGCWEGGHVDSPAYRGLIGHTASASHSLSVERARLLEYAIGTVVRIAG